MKKTTHRLTECTSTLLSLAMLLGCNGSLSLGTDASQGGSGGKPQELPSAANNPSGNAGVPAYGGTPNYFGGSGGSGGFGYAGSVSFVPGVDCVCDSVGDSVCSGSLSELCALIPGCRPSLADVKYSSICANDPAQAQYSAGERTVISYRIGANNEYQMVFDASGDLVGGWLSGYVGLACNLGGKTEFAEGVQVEAPEPTCKLCSTDANCPPGAE